VRQSRGERQRLDTSHDPDIFRLYPLGLYAEHTAGAAEAVIDVGDVAADVPDLAQPVIGLMSGD